MSKKIEGVKPRTAGAPHLGYLSEVGMAVGAVTGAPAAATYEPLVPPPISLSTADRGSAGSLGRLANPA